MTSNAAILNMRQTVRSWKFSFRSFCTAFISYFIVIGDCMVAFTSGHDFVTITFPIAAILSSPICVGPKVLWECSAKCPQMSGCAVNWLPHSVSMVVMVCLLLFSAAVRWKEELRSVPTNSSGRSFIYRQWRTEGGIGKFKSSWNSEGPPKSCQTQPGCENC